MSRAPKSGHRNPSLRRAKLADQEPKLRHALQVNSEAAHRIGELEAKLAEAERSCAAAMQVAMTADVYYANEKRRAEAAEAKLAEAEADYEQSRKQLWQQTKELSARLAEAERTIAQREHDAKVADLRLHAEIRGSCRALPIDGSDLRCSCGAYPPAYPHEFCWTCGAHFKHEPQEGATGAAEAERSCAAAMQVAMTADPQIVDVEIEDRRLSATIQQLHRSAEELAKELANAKAENVRLCAEILCLRQESEILRKTGG